MHLISGELERYLEETCDEEGKELQKINRETHLWQTKAHMLSGHYQGRVLSLISKMIKPKQILEIGTFTGYATLCLSEGLEKDGFIHTIEVNEELEERLTHYFANAALASQIKLHIGVAADIIPTIEGEFDLVFIDADKKMNLQYFEMLIDRMVCGGIILIDNVLWKGRIFDENPDSQTKKVLEFNRILAADTRVEKLILPIRDGLFALRKK